MVLCWPSLSYSTLNQVYVVLYALLGAAQGMGYTYLTSVLTTIERQFGIKSQEAAWIFSGNEIRQTNARIQPRPHIRQVKCPLFATYCALHSCM